MTVSTERPSKTDDLLDSLFETLSDSVRRHTLLILQERPSMEREELEATVINQIQIENDLLRAQLYHVHLPQLDETGLINWDKETGEIEVGSNFEAVEPYLEMLTNSN